MRWILLGPPGSGKGTQAKRLAVAHKVAHLSTGDILRHEIAKGTELGIEAKAFMERGDLVPDELILKMIRHHLSSDSSEGGFILDGFPRNEKQAQALDEMLKTDGRPVDRAVLVDVTDDEIKKRIEGRAKLEGRADDTAEVIEQRLNVYRQQTLPVAAHYERQGLLTKVNGEQSIDQVYDDLEALITA